ncbi:hypothetical protein DAPPUDRAFT_316758 [Daphnia pulex]|uniref:Ionotropic glutamate receptor C-terminal domain-containing protein n=1 Tax=Daphnia pulex TaxID=6669 RepID=E9GDX1_DAPPU|nr:hypothetical protein DAPPUDRAFT_316758 [Daphnia pulex]|eukprot:EFX82160.1 hypothetical protein DAPPUDRAFT_316758 [Daphnia pulex]
MSLLPFVIFLIWFFIPIPGSSSMANTLNGQHLRVIWQCELIVEDMVPTFQRNKVVDLTLPWTYDHFAFLIPVPDESANINAVIKPFQWPIWLGLGVSIVCVIAILNLIQRYLQYRSVIETPSRSNDNPPTEKIVNKGGTGKQYLYVFGNLLSQGGSCPSKRLPYRRVAGVWTLAAFIFVQAYTSTLFTYVVTPIHHPLINSVYDIINSNDINLLVKEEGFVNILLSTNNETGLYRALRARLDSFPNSRCRFVWDCISLITKESTNVYVDARKYLKDEIINDFRKTGKCNFELAKEEFIGIMTSFALPKNSPYTQSVSQGILELQQIGLVDYWDTWFRPMPPQCDGKPKNGEKRNKLSPLSLKNLTGAFQADLLLPDIYPTYQRNMVIDMTVVWTFDNLACLIPITDETANINAVGKSFQWPIWLGLGISIIFVIAVLNLMQRYLEYRSTYSNLMRNGVRHGHVKKRIAGKQYLYVIGNLLSQGGPCTSKRLPYRLVAGVWTLAAFIFVQAYTSTLFTYVVTPVNKPLINTINDIAEHPDINLMVKTAGTMDRNINSTGMYKKLRERLNSNPNSRCTLVSDCIKLITPGSRNVFVDAKAYLMDSIRAEFKKTGKCNLQIAKEGILTTYGTLVLPKNSPFTKSINQGLLDLIQTGIINYWDLWFRPMPGKCMRNFQSGFKMPEEKHKPHSLKNLSGAFVVVAVGLSLSLLAFLTEMIVSMEPARR